MESNALTTVFLPLSQFILMLWLGVNLTSQDFRRLRIQPKATLVGLGSQLLLLPLLGFAIAAVSGLSPALAVGVVVIAACPGGSMSNLFTLLAQGDIALSVTLTALSSVVTVFTIPVVINVATAQFMAQGTAIQLPLLSTIIQIALITLLPIALGMTLKYMAPRRAQQTNRFLKWVAISNVIVVLAGMVVKEWESFPFYLSQVGGAIFALNLGAIALGFTIATVSKLDPAETTSITIETGIQNVPLAITIASAPTLLNSADIAIPAVFYGTVMLPLGALISRWFHYRNQARQHPTAMQGSGATSQPRDKTTISSKTPR